MRTRAFVAIVMMGMLFAGLSAPGWACSAYHQTIGSDPNMGVDLVCLMHVKKQESKSVLILQGESYYFCSDVCKNTFVKDPFRYAQRYEEILKNDTSMPLMGGLPSDWWLPTAAAAYLAGVGMLVMFGLKRPGA